MCSDEVTIATCGFLKSSKILWIIIGKIFKRDYPTIMQQNDSSRRIEHLSHQFT
uniref:Uncharacterized protein n=1 Tax=Rhizophora mucronata TaxID=61149 RepID=A0A2P2PF89_RHIMU